jgi:membrane associated rhomboid family serine protease
VIPVRDENRTASTPHITWILIIVNVAAFLATWLPGLGFLTDAVDEFGIVPALILQGQNLYTLFTSMFLHGDLLHLGSNMLYLYIFGDNIEDALGHVRYVGFYLLSGLAASLAHLLTSSGSAVPAIGASGAISGVLGAYLVLYPKARIVTLVFYVLITFVRIPAIFFLGFWFILQLFSGTVTLAYGVSSGVAYWAHIGGFVAGMLVALLLRAVRKPPRTESEFYYEVEI